MCDFWLGEHVCFLKDCGTELFRGDRAACNKFRKQNERIMEGVMLLMSHRAYELYLRGINRPHKTDNSIEPTHT